MVRESRPAIAAGLALLAIYAATLAPGVTYWDSGEFLAAIHSLGIPHPPGTPLYIVVANVWAQLFTPLLGFAKSVNLLSAVCAAAGCALMADLFMRWTRDPVASFSAAICAGATSSLWLSATETEVYAPAFLVACMLLWIADAIRITGERRWWMLFAYTAGLGWAFHLTALIVLPAAVVLALGGGRQDFDSNRLMRMIMLSIPFALLGASAVLFMFVRAGHDPAVNQGNPSNVTALLDVITRRQYGTFSIWPRQAPLFLQFGNVFEWADWQFALGLDSRQPPGFLRTPVTLVFALLGIVGAAVHRRIHRPSWRALLTLLASAYIGVVLYLNLKAGPSYGAGFLELTAPHEARERDYFFILVWVCWGLWAGFGAHTVARKVFGSTAMASRAIGLMLSALPLILNWRAVDRSREPKASEARALGTRILTLAPRNAVILARGDNDSYTVWYLREVERLRPDVIPVTVPMLPADWYRAELVRRFHLLPEKSALTWQGTDSTLRGICDMARRQNRPVVGPLSDPESILRPAC